MGCRVAALANDVVGFSQSAGCSVPKTKPAGKTGMKDKMIASSAGRRG